MKVLHLSNKDMYGGSARAAYRIHNGLYNLGVDSKLLVQNKYSDDSHVITPYSSPFTNLYTKARYYINKAFQKLQNTNNSILHSSNFLPSGLHQFINNTDADIIHLHWINSEMISIREIARIKKPIVWTLHDMWPFCGAEHIADLQYRQRYIEGYKLENRPESYKGLDINRWTWKRKRKYWVEGGKEFNFVAPSTWLANCLNKSALFSGKEAKVIPNGLDIDLFKPTKKQIARKILDLPIHKKIILFGASSSKKNKMKGFQEFLEAKTLLTNDLRAENLFFIFFGDMSFDVNEKNGPASYHFGNIRDDKKLALVYSAANVIVVPSIIEAFGQTASEALACGTPVVAFNTSGLKDIIDHKLNGYLANLSKIEDLVKGIHWVLENSHPLELSKKARKKAVDKFDIVKVAQKYEDNYKQILRSCNSLA